MKALQPDFPILYKIFAGLQTLLYPHPLTPGKESLVSHKYEPGDNIHPFPPKTYTPPRHRPTHINGTQYKNTGFSNFEEQFFVQSWACCKVPSDQVPLPEKKGHRPCRSLYSSLRARLPFSSVSSGDGWRIRGGIQDIGSQQALVSWICSLPGLARTPTKPRLIFA